MSLLANSNAIESGGYNIDRSLRFRSSASAYLSRTPASSGNSQTFTISLWVKRGQLGSSNATQHLFNGGTSVNTYVGFGQLNTDDISGNLRGSGGTNYFFGTSAVYRDSSAWYHIVWSVDTTQATSSNRVFVYVNGALQSLSTANYPPQNTALLTASTRYIGQTGGGAYYFDGYLAEVNFIDGQALTPSSFGQTDPVTGVWQPKKYTGTYGTNGFYLPFTDNSSPTTLGYDKSGNGNNWTANNISTTSGASYDSMTDVPTLTSATAANFCTLNPLALRRDVATTVTFADGNLKATFNNAGGNTTHAWGTIAPTTGKFYWEITASAVVSNLAIGIGDQADQDATANHSVIYLPAGGIYKYGTLQTTAASYTTNDVIGLAYDVDAGTLAYYKNNALQYTVTGLTYIPSLPFNRGSTSDVIIANFGQRPFSYTPPTGFKALNTFNLPDPVIKKPNQYMDATTYMGTGGSQTVANSAGFAPDLVWLKMRNLAGENYVWDSVRGGGSALDLVTNRTNAEGFNSAYHNLAFASNGFTVTQIAPGNEVNYSGNTYVGWQWKKGATPGFDIVTWTGDGTGSRSVNHSLGVAPKMFITKCRNTTQNWFTFANINGSWNYGFLNTTAAFASTTQGANATALTGLTGTSTNGSGQTYVAYLFSEIPAFSKFGSYTGNGSTDGPFVYCGFRPKFILFKPSSTALGWNIYDTTRSPYNTTDLILQPNLSNAESNSTLYIDILSNGFKLRNTLGEMNGNGTTYIFACFAESPFKTSLAR